ncbi:MAG: non-ribosomal peptide synthetase, partial [Sphingobacteriales bacterium]
MDKLDCNERENSISFSATGLEEGTSKIGHDKIDKELDSGSKQRLMMSLLKAKAKNSSLTITKVNRDEKIPLSWSQQQLWLISQLDSQASRAYHVPLIVKFKGVINTTRLNDAYKTIIERHEILRTNIRVDEYGVPYQYVNPEYLGKIEEIYLDRSLKENDQKQAYDELVAELVSAPFDFEFSAPIRTSLISLDNNKSSLLIVLHHIVSDAWSLGCFTRELSILYNAFLLGQESPLQPLPIQYADYAVWQRSYLQDQKIEKDMAYWKDKLCNVPILNLPTDRHRPSIPSYSGDRVDLILDSELAQGLKNLGGANGATMFMTLLSVFKILLKRYTGQSDICVGTPLANRPFDELVPLIGYFVNTLALRSCINLSESFIDILKQIKEVTRSALEHQMLPFEKVVELVRPARSQSHSPIFQVMIALQNVGGVDARLTSTEVEYENPICT